MSRMLGSLVANPTSKSDGELELPYIALEHVEAGRGRLHPGLDLSEVARADAVCCEPGDVLFGKLRPYLAKVVVPAAPSCCSSELLVLRPKTDEIQPRFLYYLCQSRPFLDWANATSDGVKMPRTDWASLRQLRVTIPNAAEQHALVERLDDEGLRLDALMYESASQLLLLTERRQAELDNLLVHGVGRAVPTRVVSVPWEVAVPAHWDVPPLRYCVDRITVGIVVTPSAYYEPEGVPCLRGVNVRPGAVGDKPLVYMSEASNELHRKSILRAGDLVVVRTGDAGAAAVVPEWAVGGNAIDLLIVTPGDRCLPAFLELILNSEFAQRQVAVNSVGALQAHFNVGALKALRVVCPPIDEQGPIVARVQARLASLDEMSAEIQRQLSLIQEERQAVITAAVAGGIEVAA